jgi:ubiquinone/menaquinone biosynthesis C-methylase UbiE
MPTIEENKKVWDSDYDWKRAGDEWSSAWGGPDLQWYFTILPRIHAFIPAETILEIAPGMGRWTRFLKDLCENLIVVDLSEKCISACKERFRSASHIAYHVNDGRSLAMIADESVDFVFSFDSLVHAENDVIEAYLRQLATKLKKNGVGFVHHSNLGEYSSRYSLLKRAGRWRNPLIKLGLVEPVDIHWRAPSMTAARFKDLAESAGLECLSQEIVNWGAKQLTDCITIFTRKGSRWARPNRVVRNNHFWREAESTNVLSRLYSEKSFVEE